MLLTVEETKSRWIAFNSERVEAGLDAMTPGLNLALLIASNALLGQKQWSGEDYMEHPLHVGFNGTSSTTKQIVGVLHDVVEDSDWTLQDLEDIGYDKKIIDGVDAVTKRDGEKYFDFIMRCSMSGPEGIDTKIRDLGHNSMRHRSANINLEDYPRQKADVYNISYWYLVAVKKGEIEPGTPIETFVENHPEFSKNLDYINQTLFPRFYSGYEDVDVNSTASAEYTGHADDQHPGGMTQG